MDQKDKSLIDDGPDEDAPESQNPGRMNGKIRRRAKALYIDGLTDLAI